MAKGGGSENKSRFATLGPSDSLEDWILEVVPQLGAGWCPPGMLGIGVGGSADIAMRLAKQSLYEPPNMAELRARTNRTPEEDLRVRLCDKVNALGIGAQGLGGLTAVLDVKLKSAPTHASALPVALIPQCVATRMVTFRLTESDGFDHRPPTFSDWPRFANDADPNVHRVDLDRLSDEERRSWRAGDTLLLSGRLLTARDAAHKRMIDTLKRGESLPVDLRNRAIYYVGPVQAKAGEVVGPAGPTTATRMDKFTPRLIKATGLGMMIGKAERGPETVEAIRQNGTPYLIAVGGAAVLVAQSIKQATVVAYPDLGMEAIHEFRVEDMPVIVAVDAQGNSIHKTGPQRWRQTKTGA
jgi:fumarate hydratase class I